MAQEVFKTSNGSTVVVQENKGVLPAVQGNLLVYVTPPDLKTGEEATLEQKKKNGFTISKQCARYSSLMRNSMEDTDISDLQVTAIDYATLKVAVDFLKLYCDDPMSSRYDESLKPKESKDGGKNRELVNKPLRTNDLSKEISDKKYSDFIAPYANPNSDFALLYNVMKGANYLDIPGLLQLALGAAASRLRNKKMNQLEWYVAPNSVREAKKLGKPEDAENRQVVKAS